MVSFISITEDVLVVVLSFLSPLDIRRLAQTCRRLHTVARLRIVWTNACQNFVLSAGYPFIGAQPNELPLEDLIKSTTHAYALGKRWTHPITGHTVPHPQSHHYIEEIAGSSVSDLRFLPGFGDRFLVTLSRTIWSAMSVWDISEVGQRSKVCEWSPRGGIFEGFTVNPQRDSEATLALSIQTDKGKWVKILRLLDDHGVFSLVEVWSLETSLQPISLEKDLLALSDHHNPTSIHNWRTGELAILEDTVDVPNADVTTACVQVVFTKTAIVTVRQRSLHLFVNPTLRSPDDPLASTPNVSVSSHSFGWLDGFSVTRCPRIRFPDGHTDPEALFILFRGEIDDPWQTNLHNLELYALEPNRLYGQPRTPDPSSLGEEQLPTELEDPVAPYIFPPRLLYTISSLRGSLRCRRVILGKLGTAAWIQPQDRFAHGLLAEVPFHAVSHLPKTPERLVMTAFPGTLCSKKLVEKGLGKPTVQYRFGSEEEVAVDDRGGWSSDEPDVDFSDGSTMGQATIGRKLSSEPVFENRSNDWSSFDYDEALGRIALGTSFGKVAIIHL